MAKRKPPTTVEETAASAQDTGQTPSEAEAAAPAQTAAAAATPEAQSYAPVQAPPRGEGRVWTRDERLGYLKEDSADGRRRQIRFADRPDGGKPDDEILAVVREQKPHVSWSSKERAWQARKDPDGLEAIDTADQKLAEIGRKRTGVPER